MKNLTITENELQKLIHILVELSEFTHSKDSIMNIYANKGLVLLKDIKKRNEKINTDGILEIVNEELEEEKQEIKVVNVFCSSKRDRMFETMLEMDGKPLEYIIPRLYDYGAETIKVKIKENHITQITFGRDSYYYSGTKYIFKNPIFNKLGLKEGVEYSVKDFVEYGKLTPLTRRGK